MTTRHRPTIDPLLDALRSLTGNPAADFRDGQREAIEALCVRRERVLVVQRTGWGKSAVYFVATSILRQQGLGPTLLDLAAAGADAQPDPRRQPARAALHDRQLVDQHDRSTSWPSD